MYLLKYLSQCGVSSRRKAAELVKNGRVTVNGQVVDNPFVLISSRDSVIYDGKLVKPGRFVYVLLNKPKGFLTTCSDDLDRRTVMELIKNASKERLYPVGRLDRMTTGVLLFTNDGMLTQKLSHPSSEVPKIYRILLDKPFDARGFATLRSGIRLIDGLAKFDECAYSNRKDRCDITVQLHSGKYRIVRRMFESLGHKVEKLDRISYAGIYADGLDRGAWRYLTSEEVDMLKKSFA